MDSARMSGSAIDKLGDRLRARTNIADSDLLALQILRREFDDALARARNLVSAAVPGATPTSRLKTVQTLVGKLRREATMNLSQMQDIAGMRIVRAMNLDEQDELAALV